MGDKDCLIISDPLIERWWKKVVYADDSAGVKCNSDGINRDSGKLFTIESNTVQGLDTVGIESSLQIKRKRSPLRSFKATLEIFKVAGL